MPAHLKFKREFIEQAKNYCQLGATDFELGEFFKVTERQINNWKLKYPEFAEALKIGKAIADERVERSMYAKACGYKHEAVKIFMPAGAKKPVYAPYTEHVAPDTVAGMFWLQNRRPDIWRDRRADFGGVGGDKEIVIKGGLPDDEAVPVPPTAEGDAPKPADASAPAATEATAKPAEPVAVEPPKEPGGAD